MSHLLGSLAKHVDNTVATHGNSSSSLVRDAQKAQQVYQLVSRIGDGSVTTGITRLRTVQRWVDWGLFGLAGAFNFVVYSIAVNVSGMTFWMGIPALLASEHFAGYLLNWVPLNSSATSKLAVNRF